MNCGNFFFWLSSKNSFGCNKLFFSAKVRRTQKWYTTICEFVTRHTPHSFLWREFLLWKNFELMLAQIMSYCKYDFKFIQVLYLYFIKRFPNCNLYSVNTNIRYQENSLEHYVQLLSRTNQTTFLRMASVLFSRVIDFCTWKTCDCAQLYYWNIIFSLFICSLK